MEKTRISTSLSFLAIALLVVGAPGAAAARGNGIKAGNGRLHFGIDLELAFDSNPSYSSTNGFYDMMLRTRPTIALEFPSETISFELDGKVGYDYYFGVDNSKSSNLSTVSGEADMQVGINPNGQFSFFLIDTFSRSGDPRYSALAGRFDRTDNEVKALFQIKPGGGALMFDLAYGFFIDWFDEVGNTLEQKANSMALSNYGHRIYFSGKWKFLPKTALTLDFDSDLRRYPNEYSISGERGSTPEVNAIRTSVGLLGQISPTISIVIKAGYGDSLIGGAKMLDGTAYSGKDYRSAIGHAEITYRFGNTLVQGGYSRNFQPVALYAYFGQDRLYARFSQQLMGRFTILANIGFGLLDYGQSVDASDESRFDYSLSGGASFGYHILDWLDLSLGYHIQARFSDYSQPLAGAGGIDYTRHMFTFRVGVDY